MDSDAPTSSSVAASDALKPNLKKRNHESHISDLHAEPTLKKPRFATPPSTAPSQPLKQPQDALAKPKKSFVYKYGNYAGYYGYRLGELGEDPRIDQLDEQWFKGKTVLDIGCNTGVLSIRLSKKFGVEAMHGIDIDKSLINKANKNLAVFNQDHSPDISSLTPSKQKFHGGGKLSWFPSSSAPQPSTSTAENSATASETPKPSITFEVANYIRSPTQPNTYDTIMWYAAPLEPL